MKNINFDNAPAGYPIWVASLYGHAINGWHKEEHDRYTDQHGDYWLKSVGKELYAVHQRPALASVWVGVGNPPVGTNCMIQVQTEFNYLKQVEIKYYGAQYVVVAKKGVEEVWNVGAVKFLPIRTPEQVAAEAREVAVLQIMRDINLVRIVAARVYDAGYRKPGISK